MCGRAYRTYTDEELAMRYLNRKPPAFPVEPSYNIAPTQLVPVIKAPGEEPEAALMRWGLVPAWEKEFKTKLSTINAKSETVFSSKLYKSAILRTRCIVPLSGFFEWKRCEGNTKRPFAIRPRSGKFLSLGGIYSRWHDDRESFSILTISPNQLMSGVHDRMPVILEESVEKDWLNPEIQDEVRISKMMKSAGEDALDLYEISTAVNSPRNNRPDILNPI